MFMTALQASCRCTILRNSRARRKRAGVQMTRTSLSSETPALRTPSSLGIQALQVVTRTRRLALQTSPMSPVRSPKMPQPTISTMTTQAA